MQDAHCYKYTDIVFYTTYIFTLVNKTCKIKLKSHCFGGNSGFIFSEEYPLHTALGEHCVGDLDEACNVCAIYVVDVAICCCTILNTRGVDICHDLM